MAQTQWTDTKIISIRLLLPVSLAFESKDYSDDATRDGQQQRENTFYSINIV